MSAEVRQPPFYLGIDLGGTNIKAGVVDDAGRSLSSVSLETQAERGPWVGLDNLAEAARRAVESSGLGWDDIAHVGLGSPGTMDIPAGLLLQPPNLPGWENFPIRRLLEEQISRPTILQNDGNAAAYGEFWVGAGKGARSLVMFTLGTGVGGGIISEGRIIEGRHSHGGECGHVIVQMEGGRVCPCGGVGHLEAYASATALVKRAAEALGTDQGSMLYTIQARGDLTSRAIGEAARAGDPLAVRLLNETARYLAVGAATLMHTIDPDIVLFGGGMIAAGSKFLDAIRSEIHRVAFQTPAQHTRVEFAQLGGSAGFIGAAGCARTAHQSLDRR